MIPAILRVAVPAWGSTGSDVVAVDGDTWSVRDTLGRVRELAASELNLAHVVPVRVAIRATRGDRVRDDPAPGPVEGEERRAWSVRRLAQIAKCRELGWRVVGLCPAGTAPEIVADEIRSSRDPAPGGHPVERPRPSGLDIRPGAVLGSGDAFNAVKESHRTPNPKWAAWRYHQRGPEPVRAIYPSGPVDPQDPTGRQWLPRGAVTWDEESMTLREMPLGLANGIAPYWYQSEAVAAVLAAGRGVVEAPCGAGKTGIGTFLAARVDGRALVLVHTLDLVRQWRDRLETWIPGAVVGQVGGGKAPDGSENMVVASLATLARWSWDRLESFGAGFGLLICDECHHVPAETWIRVVSALPCPARMGLTATPERKDGLHTWMHLALGPTVYQIAQSTLDNAGRTMRPTIWQLDTGVEPVISDHPAHTMRSLLEDDARQSQLCRVVRRMVAGGRRVLVLTSLVDHAHATADALGGSALVGSVSAKQRSATLAAMRSGDLSVIVATQLADEGLDLPELDTVVLAAPSSHKAATRQRIGRACRAMDGKRPPLIVDMVDTGTWAGRKWAARRSLYRAMDWPIRRMP